MSKFEPNWIISLQISYWRIVNWSWRYQKAVYSLFWMNICQWKSCVQSGCRVYSQSIKNNKTSTIQSIVSNCFNPTKRSFCINMWQWMKHGSTTSLWSQISSQLNRQQHVKSVKSDQRRKHHQARFWPSYLGMRKVFCSLITMRKEELSIVNIR